MVIRIAGILLASVFLFQVQAQIPEGYYDNAEGLSGEPLKAALNDIIDGHTEFSYDELWDLLKVTDRDPDNPNNVIGIYSRFSMDGAKEYDNAAGWSREHVWAKSRGDFGEARGAGTDLHHMRAEDVSTNSARSNKPFDNGGSTYTDASGNYSGVTPCKTSSSSWEPGDIVKGDVARAIFYMAVRYEGENGELDLELTEELLPNDDKSPVHGKLSTLLAWHEQDPVSEAEITRNNLVHDYQLNRNPFIDHPEYVGYIWGDDSPEGSPTISTTESSLSFGTVSAGLSSSVSSYQVNGTDITADVTVSVEAPFEVSLSENSGWAQSVVISESNVEAGSSNYIYVRFSPTETNSQTYNAQIGHSSTGATIVYVDVSGTESTVFDGPASLTVASTALDFGSVSLGSVSEAQMVVVNGVNLSESLTISTSGSYKVSQNPTSDYSNQIQVSPVIGKVEDTIYVVFSPASLGFNSASLKMQSTGLSKSVSLTGTCVEAEKVLAYDVDQKPNVYVLNGFLELENINQDSAMVILDMMGHKVYSAPQSTRLNVSAYSSGLYFLVTSDHVLRFLIP